MALQDTIIQVHDKFISEAINSPSLLADMASMEKYMSESYCGRILVELLQNADDAESRNVLITEWKDCVIVANDGRPFSDDDVLAISRSGASNKKRGENIGYRGVGFKSTSFLSEDIIIFSNNTGFCFSKEETARALNVCKEQVPTIRIPFIKDVTIYNDIINKLCAEGYTTIFIFSHSDSNVLSEELNSLSSDMLLFLRNVECVNVNIGQIDKKLIIKRKLESWGQIIDCDSKQWAIVDSTLGFVYEDGSLVSCRPEDSVYYSFLPTCDKCLYSIKINGNFSTDPSRKHIRVDDATHATIDKVANLIGKLIQNALDNPCKLYKNITSIFKANPSFDVVNRTLKSKMDDILSNTITLRLNNGQIIPIHAYKSFSEDLDNSIIRCVRTTEGPIKGTSMNQDVYDNIDGIDKFMSELSVEKVSDQDIVELISTKSVVESIPDFIYSLLLGKTITAYNRYQITGGKLEIDKILTVKSNGKIIPLKDSGLTSNDIMTELQINDSNQSVTKIRLKSFCNALNIKFVEDKLENTFGISSDNKTNMEKTVETDRFYKVYKSDKPVIAKWRSAENACMEIERFLGNTVRDVSAQNIGYDVESTTPNGEKRYIEVKSIKPSDGSFSITNNEYTSAHQHQDNYYICLIIQSDVKSKAIYIKNPISNIHFEKRIRQWEWFCEEYEGDEIDIEY